ncbi:hypothetical protein EMCRGX_G001086 [Ephydatia muelleri]
MSILKYIVPIRPGVSSKEDSDVRQTSGSTGSRSAEVILHSSESSSEPISGSDEVVGLLEECGHDEANAPDSPSPTTSPVTCTRIVPLKPNQPRLKFPMRQFGIQDAVKANPIIHDALDTIEEMSKLIKKSPRRQVIFQKVKNDIALDSPGIRLLCPTRWTVKAEAFTSISENYEALMETWAEAKQINNDREMRARIGGVAKQMESFDFFFGLELGRIVFSMSDNLSKALQGSSISASEGQSLMKMTLVAFQAIRSEDSFSVFWKTIEGKRQLCKAVLIADPSLPRQRKVPKHLEIGSSAPEFANIAEDVYRKAYYEIIDFVVQSIKDRFDQNGYKMLSKLEELLCDSECKLEDYSDVMQLYGDDVNQQRMACQLLILHANLPHEIKSLVGGMKLKGIIAFLQSLSLIESELYTEVIIKLAKLIIVMPATNAVSERTFSALRRLKTWLRSTLHQSRLNWCMLLHVHKDESDKLDLAIIGNEFASRNSSRQELFGIFP